MSQTEWRTEHRIRPARPQAEGPLLALLRGGSLIAILALILIFQNSQKVEFEFFFVEGETPLFFALIIAFLLGALVGWLLPHVRRGRRRHDEKDD